MWGSKGIKGGSFLFMGKGDQGRFFFVYGQRGSRAVLFVYGQMGSRGVKGGSKGIDMVEWQECMRISL